MSEKKFKNSKKNIKIFSNKAKIAILKNNNQDAEIRKKIRDKVWTELKKEIPQGSVISDDYKFLV